MKMDDKAQRVEELLETSDLADALKDDRFKQFLDKIPIAILVECLASEKGCTVVVADDGIGLPAGTEWPQRGNLGALIVQSLRENANAELKVESKPGDGTRVTLIFAPTSPARA